MLDHCSPNTRSKVKSWDSATAEDNVLDGSIQQPRPTLNRSLNPAEYEISNPVLFVLIVLFPPSGLRKPKFIYKASDVLKERGYSKLDADTQRWAQIPNTGREYSILDVDTRYWM